MIRILKIMAVLSLFGNEANLQTRLGLRWLSEQNTASTKKDSFFAEVNWLHNSNNYTISSLGDSISQDGNKNLGEIRLGYEKKNSIKTGSSLLISADVLAVILTVLSKACCLWSIYSKKKTPGFPGVFSLAVYTSMLFI